MKQRFAAAICGVLLAGVPAFSQEDYTRFKNEGTVQMLGSFVRSTTENKIEQKTTNSGGVLGTYRYWFNRHSGAEVNYAYTLNTEKYGGIGVNTHSNELTAAYVFRMPYRRWSPFVLAGAGALVFNPKNANSLSTQARAAFVYGGGADINLTDHFYLRGEYRGLVYNSPTYDYAAFDSFGRVTHRAEPSVGLGWRF